jgi:hypothetical protein
MIFAVRYDRLTAGPSSACSSSVDAPTPVLSVLATAPGEQMQVLDDSVASPSDDRGSMIKSQLDNGEVVCKTNDA